MRSTAVASAVFVLLLVSRAHAGSLLVLPDGTGDYPTIQAAVDAASDGDEVLLGNGTFTGSGNRDVQFRGKAITVRSTSGIPSSVVIDCENQVVRAFRFANDEGSASVVASLTIVNSKSSAILCRSVASPTIRDVIIEESLIGVDHQTGAAILENMQFRGCRPGVRVWHGSPLITGCVFEANTVDHTHARGGIALVGGAATIESCTIQGNGYASRSYLPGAGGIVTSSAQPTIRDCLITGNNDWSGAIVVTKGSSVSIEGCTVASNRGVALSILGGSTVSVEHSILWANCGTGEVYVQSGSSAIINCSNLPPSSVGGPGLVTLTDVLEVDPEFCDPHDCSVLPMVGGVFTLHEGSLALSQPCGPMGALGAQCAIAIQEQSWAAIKARYR